ncbi:dipeptide ABC transporter ATP-binding protein [Burkholderia oklahomensis]|uniref:dipeptide ABC transporter ATP-binding protein n=4 Tax=Burkholderia oklahomensis TaxID=342113 RepID=UPI000572534D|nr:ABC transporter ATP-binding protein [Burkholderia oklahomensis]AOI42819.1 microcin ABC transporter ATP-binding protein [Burkholderia oklahomensis EO147]AOI46308.1 microcin ABC transporter ATP-binding protein [Burkholderia oklahomensis C6786]KUY53934.1 microcin ABC transporter ATP-binding protein [Burkholderia oklahomensis C6786]KUY61240.1 microcin ABC transporter ATP-binding protein [Burkholderia oklahomensis EO147]MBI0361101.1 ABC transporter ATP-binding protein [Burkholderia oklahomensis]
MNDTVLEIEALSIGLPPGASRRHAVHDVSLRLRAGRTLCVVGESGSGKSILAHAIIGLLPAPGIRATAGRIVLGGEDLLALDAERLRALRGRRIGMVFQEPMSALDPLMRIGAQLGEGLDAHLSLPAAQRRTRILAALREAGLDEPERWLGCYPFQLSGGQRQRVLIACAMLLEPALLIADEPTTALDVTTQAQILRNLRAMQRRRSTALLFITHDLGVAAEIGDDLAVMLDGEIVESGPLERVLATPAHAYTRRLVAAMPDGTRGARGTHAALRQAPRVLEVSGLTKTYHARGLPWRRGAGVDAVRAAGFVLHRGETLGLVGESGSGKSTLGRCVAGLVRADAGRIVFAGGRPGSAKGRIQMVFQDPQASLNPRRSVGAAIAAGPIAQGMPRADAMRRAAELLDLVGLGADAAARWPHAFSGGQRQRIAIARALATEPDLLIADEPLSALDMPVQAQVLALLADVQARFGLAMLFITHDLRVAAMICDTLAVMRHGEIVEAGEAARVLAHPAHPYTRALIDAVPVMPASLAARREGER